MAPTLRQQQRFGNNIFNNKDNEIGVGFDCFYFDNGMYGKVSTFNIF